MKFFRFFSNFKDVWKVEKNKKKTNNVCQICSSSAI